MIGNSPGPLRHYRELLFIRGPAVPSVVSGFLTADGKAGPRMKKAARGGAGDSHKVRLALPGNTL